VIKGLYTAASAMLVNQYAVDNLADNMANVNTVGFKRQGVQIKSFPELFMNKLQNGKQQTLGGLSTGVQLHATPIYFEQGPMRQTGNPLDVAIEGQGFFKVQRPNGDTAYTRNGSFKLDANGQLATQQGDLLLGQGGLPLTVPAGSGAITINPSGVIQAQRGGELGRLDLAIFSNPSTLKKLGGNLFTSSVPPSQELTPGSSPEVGTLQQGALEQANVKVLTEMVQLIAAQRLQEALQKAIQTQNGTLGKAVNEVGKA
jgi:flagellar basal-body rod protein FlgG